MGSASTIVPQATFCIITLLHLVESIMMWSTTYARFGKGLSPKYDETTEMITIRQGDPKPFNSSGFFKFSSFQASGYIRATHESVGWSHFAYWVCFLVHFGCEIAIAVTNGKGCNAAKLLLNIAASLVAPFLFFINAFDTTSYNFVVCTVPSGFLDLAVLSYYGYIALGVVLGLVLFVFSRKDEDIRSCLCCFGIVSFLFWIIGGMILRISFPMIRSSPMALAISIVNLVGYVLEWIALVFVCIRDKQFYVLVIFTTESKDNEENEE